MTTRVFPVTLRNGHLCSLVRLLLSSESNYERLERLEAVMAYRRYAMKDIFAERITSAGLSVSSQGQLQIVLTYGGN